MSSQTKAQTIKTFFSRTTSVEIKISAIPSKIWSLLTNSIEYPKWNSTVISIEGEIASGSQIKLKSSLSPERVFKLKILEFEPNKKLVWGDPMGKRTFTLTEQGDESILFSMSEKIGGPLFPLFASMIPSFDKNFEDFATDLKQAAENV